MTKDLPLGRTVDYPTQYAPDQLRAISRAGNRAAQGIQEPLPFVGEDQWTAWELSWLEDDGRPAVAAVDLRIPADSPNIVESKSLKLYLNSFAMSTFADASAVQQLIQRDLSDTVGRAVTVTLFDQSATLAQFNTNEIGCIDQETADFVELEEATLRLSSDAGSVVEETVYSELFRSLCPVTAQPDFARISVAYRGPAIDRGALLAYLVAFREHQDFHEACVERIFVDVLQHCSPEALCVSARFLRRGGIDINPWRAIGDMRHADGRIWRQ